MRETADFLIELSSLPGPSGYEDQAAKHVKELLEPFMDETWIDSIGNVIGARHCGYDNARKLLIDAHIDEIGLVVTGIEEGFLRFEKLGSIDVRMLPACDVEVLTNPPLYGVIDVLPPHVLKKEETERFNKIDELFIDIGLTQEQALAQVPLGTPIVMMSGARCFAENYVSGKALDNRAGVAAVLNAIEMLKDVSLEVDLYVMFSTQEEVGVRGATPGVYAISPDWCLVVDVDHAKTPDAKQHEAKEELGSGVIISRGPNMHGELTEKMIALAKNHDIRHQVNVAPGGNSGTNARAIQISREGVATALLGIPLRYMHSPQEVVSIDDVESASRLVYETAKAVTKCLEL